MDRTALLLVCTAILAGASGCGSDDDGGSTQSSAPCASETFTLKGELDTQAVDLALPLGDFSVWVTKPGDSFAQFGTYGKLTLSYGSPLTVGEPVPASGTPSMPTEAPAHAGETLCVGQGTTFTYAENEDTRDGYTFRLESIQSGSSCETAVAGALDGCFAYTFEEG